MFDQYFFCDCFPGATTSGPSFRKVPVFQNDPAQYKYCVCNTNVCNTNLLHYHKDAHLETKKGTLLFGGISYEYSKHILCLHSEKCTGSSSDFINFLAVYRFFWRAVCTTNSSHVRKMLATSVCAFVTTLSNARNAKSEMCQNSLTSRVLTAFGGNTKIWLKHIFRR